MYRVFIERSADKDLATLDNKIEEKIVEMLESLKINPRPKGAKKLIGGTDAWRIRAGDIRILYEVDDTQKEVRIYRIKKRDKAYQDI